MKRSRMLSAGAGVLLLLAAVQARPARFDGEYGLFVRLEGDSVRVGWITPGAGPGFLQAVTDGRVRFEVTTPPDSAHTTVFRRHDSNPILLRYGSADAPAQRWETVIDPRTGTRRPPVRIRDADRVFVLGDTHGELDTLTHVLRAAGVLDERLRWAAGSAHLVVLGDVTDRGADVTPALWLLYRLEREAAAAGGGLHMLLGNHELMVMMGDLRYVGHRELAIARMHGVTYDRLFDPRYSVLGRWLASRPALLRIEDVLFAHGGVAPEYLDYTLQSVDDTLAAFTGEELFYRWADTAWVAPLDSAGIARRSAFFWGPNSLFWHRGYAQADTLGAALDAVLDHFDSELLVVGHTPGRMIRQAYDGRLLLTNTYPFGRELLLLRRAGDGWERLRIGTDGLLREVPRADSASTP